MLQYVTTLAAVYLTGLLFLLGLVLGSGLNCLAWRLSHGEKWSGSSRSHCSDCGHTLGATDLVPLFSWLLLGGKCRYCGKPISIRYPLTELTLGIVYAVCLWRYDLSAELAVQLILFSCLFTLSIVDLYSYEIPDRFLILPAAVRIVYLIGTLGLSRELLLQLIPAAGILLGLLALVLIMDRVLQTESMGGGDIKLLAVLGLFFPFSQWMLLLFLSCICGLVLAFTLGAKKGIAFPFGPAISASAFLTALIGGPLTGWYFSLF